MAISKDFRKVSKRGKCLFFGFLEIISSKNENRWDVHPYVRLHYIITKKRRIFYEWLTIHLGFFLTWLWSLPIRGETSAQFYFIILIVFQTFMKYIYLCTPIPFTITSAKLSSLFSISEKWSSWSCTSVCTVSTNFCSSL